MRLTRVLLFGALLLPATALADDVRNEKGNTPKQEADAKKSDQAAKKGALKEKKSPAADLKLQEENVKKLREDAAQDRKVGNRAGAWAADMDARHAQKLVDKDKKLLEQHKSK